MSQPSRLRKDRPRKPCRPLAFALPLFSAVTAGAAEHIRFEIPPQPLKSALLSFGKQSGRQLLYGSEMTEGLKTEGLSGEYPPEKALDRLLAGTQLTYSVTPSGTVTLARAEKLATQVDPINLPTVSVQASGIDDPSDPYNDNYAAPTATTATKTETPFLETPGTVNVVTRKQLVDRQVFDVAEAFKYTAGVNPANGGRTPFDAGLYLRGFRNTEFGDLGGFYYRDGFRMSGIPLPIANLDRIELLKGPAAVLYGRAEPGGLVNAIYKRPLDTPYYMLEQQFGSFDLYRTSVDATGPITDDGAFLYRFNLQNIEEGSFRDHLENNLLSIAPSLAWKPSEDTRIDVQFEYSNTGWNYPTAIPAVGDRPARIPPKRFIGDGAASGTDWGAETYVASVDLNHRFNEDWSLRWNALYANQKLIGIDHTNIGGLDDATGDATYAYNLAEPNDHRRWWFTSLNVVGNVDIYGIRNKFLFGFDYNNDKFEGPYYWRDVDLAFNIYNPVYGQVKHLSRRQVLADLTPADDYVQINRWYGLYIQDQIDLTDQLHLTLGGRYDDTEYFNGNPADEKINHVGRLNPRYGIVYQPLTWLSAYFQYMESLGASNGRSATGKVFEPQTAEQYEAGFKSEFFDGRLTSSLAFFRLEKQNLLTTDPTNPAFRVPIGEARSQGIEFEIVGRVIEGLNLIGSYALTDTRITESSDGDRGNRLPNVPLHAGSLWTTYDVTDQFTVGAGVYVAGQREGDAANSYQLPGYARLDMMAAYRWFIGRSRLTAQVNVNNVLDKDYFSHSTESRFGALPGQPLTVLGSVRFEY
jgi:iron complex outermembrane receptor protein